MKGMAIIVSTLQITALVLIFSIIPSSIFINVKRLYELEVFDVRERDMRFHFHSCHLFLILQNPFVKLTELHYPVTETQ